MPRRFAKPYDLADLYLAYRKAKAEAFYENTHFHAIAFTKYEKTLDQNLRDLLKILNAGDGGWAGDVKWLGGYTYAPKGISSESPAANNGVFYRCLDPLEEWSRQWPGPAGEIAQAEFRLLITPSVNFQIISALWILKTGHKYDAALDSKVSFGNRLRRRKVPIDWKEGAIFEGLNTDCIGIFAPYYSAYRQWRGKGLSAMRSSLEAGKRIYAITMDLQKFYHRVNPEFLCRSKFIERLGINLFDEDLDFTRSLIQAIGSWYKATPDHHKRPEGAIPVGLSASKIIANVLLAELDARIVKDINPIYYGRYVDDIFMVVEATGDIDSGGSMMAWLSDRVTPMLSVEQDETNKQIGLRVNLDYAEDSKLIFSGAKQKVFNLSGAHGLDLIGHIEEQIRHQSSEHKLLAELPHTSERMAARTLLAQSDASLEADALRKAGAVSVRRLGLSLLLRDVETYARELRPSEWLVLRREFYGLVHRHALTPSGVFNFFAYTHRVLGLMVACGDFEEALRLVNRLKEVIEVLLKTSTAGTKDREEFFECRRYFASALLQVSLQSATVSRFRWAKGILAVFSAIRDIGDVGWAPRRLSSARKIADDLLYADFGRRAYRELWLSRASRKRPNPPVPPSLSIRRLLRLGAIREFRKTAKLHLPYWPAIAFPTRPLSLSEITFAAPDLLMYPHQLRAALFAVRGALARSHDGVNLSGDAKKGIPRELVVDSERKGKYKVALPSFLTTNFEWECSVKDRPQLTLKRYERLRRLINQMLRDQTQIDYVVFPECSIPRAWVSGIAYKLANKGISLIAGLEYETTSEGVRNDAYLSLATGWPWYRTSVIYVQPKFSPAHEERRNLRALAKKRLYRPVREECMLPIYVHGGICFSILICSDLTNIDHRRRLRGDIDGLFVIEWNKDVETFGALLESTANDLHVYAIQSNNRMYGDSRIRSSRKKSYERDLVRVRGGLHDYFVIAEIDVTSLRDFQRRMPSSDKGPFKPVPIGYKMSERRRYALIPSGDG